MKTETLCVEIARAIKFIFPYEKCDFFLNVCLEAIGLILNIGTLTFIDTV
jgi:hypothetical protein